MSQLLPAGGFKWFSDVSRFTSEKTGRLAKHGRKGYLLDVDVKYPKELHDQDNDLQFMGEKMKINEVEKLVSNLYDKKKYVIHLEH